MKTVAIIQARTNSTRLPGKVLKDLGGRSVLAHVIDRVAAAAGLDEVVIATTSAEPDGLIVCEAERHGAKAFRGSEHDVLGRYFMAATANSADVIVRVTADCPLFDSRLLTQMLTKFSTLRTGPRPIDYMSNTLTRTYPRGLDTEIFTFAALRRAHREANLPHEREHVTPYLYHNPTIFALHEYNNDIDLSAHRWTLDTPDDFRFLLAVFSALHERGEVISTEAVLGLLDERPDIAEINAHIRQQPLIPST